MHTGSSLCGDGAQFDADRMCAFHKVTKPMTVTPNSSELGASTAEISTGKAKPQVFFQVTLVAVRQP